MLKVAQCWDDGVATDVRLTSILRKYNAKATFNLCPGILKQERVLPRWISAQEKGWSHKGFLGGHVGREELVEVYSGFQVASHCMHHEVAGKIPDDQFLKGAVDARKYLEEVFQRECRGFAWPCSGHTPETMKALHEAGFAYARIVGRTDTVIPCKDSMALCPSCHFQDNDFWDRFEAAKKTGVFYFWGHSYETLDYEKLWEQLEFKIAAISAAPDVKWVDVIDLVE